MHLHGIGLLGSTDFNSRASLHYFCFPVCELKEKKPLFNLNFSKFQLLLLFVLVLFLSHIKIHFLPSSSPVLTLHIPFNSF